MQLFYRTGYVFRYILRLLFGLSIIGFALSKIYHNEWRDLIAVYIKTHRKIKGGNRVLFIREFWNLINKYTDKGNK